MNNLPTVSGASQTPNSGSTQGTTSHGAPGTTWNGPTTSFLDLPAEIRLPIYNMLLDGAYLVVRRHAGAGNNPPYYTVEITSTMGAGILKASKIIRDETMALLPQKIKLLRVPADLSHVRATHRLSFFRLPLIWRQRITVVDYCISRPKATLQLPLFANLQHVTIGVRMYHVKSQDKPHGQDVGNQILDIVSAKAPHFEYYHQDWIRGLPTVKVVLTVWIHNHQKRQDDGWVARIDVSRWQMLDFTPATFEKIPCPPLAPFPDSDMEPYIPAIWRRTRAAWNRRLESWKVEVVPASQGD